MKPAPRRKSIEFCSLCGFLLNGCCKCPWRLPFGQWPLGLRKQLLTKVAGPSEGTS